MEAHDRLSTTGWPSPTRVCGSVLLLALAAAPAAWARPPYNNHVPNGREYECDACHTQAPWLDSFGIDVGLTLPLGNVDWSLVWDLDSDGDGQSNGFELGDPCGDWTRGSDAARQEDISDPSDPDSRVPESVVPPTCPGGDDDDSAPGDDDDSASEEPEAACGYSFANARPPAAAPALLLLILVRRRRRS